MVSHAARALRITEPVIGKPAIPVGVLEVRVKTDDFCESRYRFLIAAGDLESCRFAALEQPTFGKRDGLSTCDDDVIENPNVEQR